MLRKLKLSLSTFLVALLLLVGVAFFATLEVDAQGGMTTFNGIQITTFYRAVPRSTITMTQDATLNATGTYQPITAAGAVSTSGVSITVKPRGTVLILVNVGSNTITFTETGTLVSAGNIALGANDSATLISNGTNWYQIAASNN